LLRFLLIEVLLITLGLCTNAQTIQWAKTIDGSYNVLDDEAVKDVEIASDGSVYAAGYFDADLVFGTDTLEIPSGVDAGAYIVQYDVHGNPGWIHGIVSTNGNCSAYEVALDTAGNVVVGMRVEGSFQLDTVEFTNIPFGSMLIAKFSPEGTYIWHQLFEGSGSSSNGNLNTLIGLELNTFNEVYIGLVFGDTLTIGDTTIQEDFFYLNDDYCALVKLAPSGAVDTVSIVNPLDAISGSRKGGISISHTDGSVYMIFQHDSFNIGLDTIQASNISSKRAFICRYNSQCELLWHRSITPIPTGFESLEIASDSDNIFFAISAPGGTGSSLYYEEQLIDSNLPTKYIFGKINTSGSLLEYYPVSHPSNPWGVTWNGLKIEQGLVYIGATVYERIAIGNLNDTLSPPNTKTPVPIIFNDSTDEFSIPFEISSYNYFSDCYAIDVDQYQNIVVGGSIRGSYGSLEVDTFELAPMDNSGGYVIKHLACNHLTSEVVSISGDSLICGNASLALEAQCSAEDIGYQWLFSGTAIPGATDSIYQASIPGIYSVQITDSLCQRKSDKYVVSSGSPETVSFNPPQTTFCSNDSAYALTGGTPTGGYYTGTGVSGGYFDPGQTGGGNYTVYYVYTQSTGCVDSVSATMTVTNSPTAYFFPSFTEACSGDSVTLTTGVPTGGTYSGEGVTGNVFAPTLSDTGSQTLVYTITQSGCSSSDSIMVDVNPSPIVTLNLGTDTTCEAASPVLLTGNSPSGGVYSGTGVTGNYFVPGVVNPGSYPITYSVTEDGCTTEAIDTIQVDSFPDVVLPTLDSICLSAVSLPLTHGYPASGVYSGSGVSGNSFTASVPGLGIHALTYIYENACAADTAYSTVHVIASPTLSSSITAVSCNGLSDGSITASVSGGNFPYTYSWNNGDSAATLSGQMAGTYTVTVSGEGGCTASQSFSITEPAVLSLVLDSLDNVVCNGFTDGKAYVSATGGTSAYTYAWTNGITTEDNLTLASGTHTLTVTDANGCEDSLSVNITEVNPVSVTGTVSDVSCYGLSDGSINTTATGGGGTYSYAWSNGTNTANNSSLITNTYTLTTTDQNGCEALDTFTITEPDSLELSVTAQHVDCYGSASGNLSSTSGGGTPAYNFLWSNGNTTDSISGLIAGTYTLTITDQQSCSKAASLEITEPDSLSVSVSTSQALLCSGDNNGALNSSVSGGTTPYSYAWSTGATNASISNLSTGTYTITLTDANGCTDQKTTLLAEPSAVVIQIDSVNDVSCHGLNDGAVHTQAVGGTSGYTYAWSNGDTLGVATALDSGIHTLTITDANGCEADTSIAVNSPTAITTALTTQNISCFGLSDGTIQSSVQGGAGGYSYAWNSGDTSATLINKPAGTFVLTITDADGCNMTDSVVLTQPGDIEISLSAQNNLCFGDSTGGIVSSVMGGTVPYSYVWNTGDTVSAIDSLTANTYSITVTDSNGCESDTSVLITQPTALTLSVDSLSNILCFGDSTGYAALSTLGGTGSSAYLWPDGDTLATKTDLWADIHTIVITDSNGCEIDTTIQITQPAQLQLNLDSVEHLTCFEDSSGYLAYSGMGGITPYTYAWSNGTTGYADSLLPAGVYSITLTDSNGCIIEQSDTLYQPDEILVSDSVINATCSNDDNGMIIALALGGIGSFSYAWSSGFMGDTLNGHLPGPYTLTVTDDNGCEKEHMTTLGYQFLAPVNDLGNDTAICDGDSVELCADSPGLHIWSTGEIGSCIWVTDTQTVTLDIEDTNGCITSDTVNIEVNDLPLFSLGTDTMMCSDSLLQGLVLNGPVNMTTYLWSTGTALSTETITQFGTHWLAVVDSNSCGWTDSIQVVKDTCTGIEITQALSDVFVYPNPTRGAFTVQSSTPVEVELFNMQGELILKATSNQVHELDLSGQAAGVYLIKVLSIEKLNTLRIIKE